MKLFRCGRSFSLKRFRIIARNLGRKSNDRELDNQNIWNCKNSKLLNGLRVFATVLTSSWCFTRYIAEPILLQGPSMEPTIQNNDVIIADKYSVNFGQSQALHKGDIIVARSPLNPHQFICKRIVALPGDEVQNARGFGYGYNVQIPKGHVWLLGDNRLNSTDSREFGAVPIGLIIGRVVLRIFPFNRITNFKNEKET
ncbi:ubiquitin-conjugating enzyme E2Q-like protein [Sarcoptes scabiei]|nr:ubiquitin-conjugating enzyme E2Q-like protein [Sarcoptes scabiei]